MKISSEYFLDGKELLVNGESERAADIFLKGLDKFPDDKRLLVGLANAEFKLGNKINAFRLLKYAKKLAPDDTEVTEFFAQVESRIDKSAIPEITLSMIVKNEEKDLPSCLESVEGIVGEIVIVDTGSTDSTIEIARKYGAKVYHTEWHEDFARARNVALRHSTGNWVLYLDADERLDNFTRNILRNSVEYAEESYGGLECIIFSKHLNDRNIPEMYTGVYPRLFRNLGYPVCKFFGRVHEQIAPSLTEKGYKLASSEIRIIHTGYDISRDEMDKKVRRNLQRLMDHAKEEPENGLAWYQLGNSLAQMKIYDQAIPALETAVHCTNLSAHIASNTAVRLSMINAELGNKTKALQWVHKALEILPGSEPALELRLKLQG